MTEEKKMEVKHEAVKGFKIYYYVALAVSIGYLVYSVLFTKAH